MDNALLLPIILQIVGLGVIVAEVFLPSGGLLTVLALGLFGFSLYYVFTELSHAIGFIFVAMDLILVPITIIVGFKLLARSPLTLHKTLSRTEGVLSQPSDLTGLVDKQGTTLTILRPSGKAIIDGKRVDVVTRGEFIDKDTAVKVVAVTGNQIIVSKQNLS